MCKSFDEGSKEHVGKVEGVEGALAWEGGVASELAIEEEGVFVHKGVKSI